MIVIKFAVSQFLAHRKRSHVDRVRRSASEIRATGVAALKPRLSRLRRRRSRLEMLRDSLDARKDTAMQGAANMRDRAEKAAGRVPFVGTVGATNGTSHAASAVVDDNATDTNDAPPETTTEDR